MTTDPTGTGAAIPQEWLDVAARGIRNVVMSAPENDPATSMVARAALDAALPRIAKDLRAQWEVEHWSAGFTVADDCPTREHPTWAVEGEWVSSCPGCIVGRLTADLAAANEERDEWSNDIANMLDEFIVEDDVSQEALIEDAIRRVLADLAAARQQLDAVQPYLNHSVKCRTWRGQNWAGACDCNLFQVLLGRLPTEHPRRPSARE